METLTRLKGLNMTRIEKEIKLVKLTNELLGKPFQKGLTDCNIIGVSVIDLFLGTDYLSVIKGKYTTYKAGGALGQEQVGYSRISELLDDVAAEITIEQMTVGDLMIQKHRTYDSVVVCLGLQFLTSDITEKRVKLVAYDYQDLDDVIVYRL